MNSTTYIVTIHEPGNCTSSPADIATILTSRDRIAPRERVEVEAQPEPTVLYEIELDGPNFEGEPYYHTTIVKGPFAPAGQVPASVDRHARLLASIAGPRVLYRVGYHEPTDLTNDGVPVHASTIWLT